jgi:EmrB/QacA subfamily drug resistance transporter
MSHKGWTLVAVVLGSGIVFLDSTVVNVALPAMGQQLSTTFVGLLEGQSYVVNGYLLTLASLLVLAGALADSYGRRLLFLIGLLGFGVSSVLCGLAPNMEALIGFRLLQGASGALLVPTSLAIITATFTGPERGRAFGVWAAASGATTIFGPILGGFLVDVVSWRAIFLINAPLVAFGMWVAWRFVAESRDEQASRRFDWLGAVVVALAVGGLAFGAIRGEARGWTDLTAVVPLVTGVLASAAFVPLMALRRNVLVPLTLFRSRNFSVSNISTLLIYGSLYATGYLWAVYFQGTLGYTAMAAGLAGLPISLLLVLFSTRAGSLAGKIGPRSFMALGPALMGLGLLWFLRVSPESAAWRASVTELGSLVPPVDYLVDILPAVTVFAIGLVILVAPLTTAVMSSVPARNSGLASAINNAVSRVGPLFVVPILFIAISVTFYAGLEQRAPEIDTRDPQVRTALSPLNRPPDDLTDAQTAAARQSSTDAFRLAMLIASLLCLTGAAVNAVGIRNEELLGIGEAAAEPETGSQGVTGP